MAHPSSPLGDTVVSELEPSADASGSGDQTPKKAGRRSGVARLLRRDLAVDRLSGVYVIIIMVIGFSLWEPATFGTLNNARVIVSSEAITGIITLGLIMSLIAGVFDISIAANMSLAISVVGKLQASAHMNAALAVIVTLTVGAVIGCMNAVIVTRFKIDAVIGTLAMSSILAAVSYWVASGQTVLYGISDTFKKFGSAKPLSIPISVYYLAVIALVLWYVLEHTPVGRYLYAAGANPQAARLSGVNVVRLQ